MSTSGAPASHSGPSGPARMAAPLPAYGGGAPASAQATPAPSRSAAPRVPGPAPTARPSAKRAPTRRANPAGSKPRASRIESNSSRASWVSSEYWPGENGSLARKRGMPARRSMRTYCAACAGGAASTTKPSASPSASPRRLPAARSPTVSVIESLGGADRVGFEPTIPLPVYRFSRPAPSATRTPVLDCPVTFSVNRGAKVNVRRPRGQLRPGPRLAPGLREEPASKKGEQLRVEPWGVQGDGDLPAEVPDHPALDRNRGLRVDPERPREPAPHRRCRLARGQRVAESVGAHVPERRADVA